MSPIFPQDWEFRGLKRLLSAHGAQFRGTGRGGCPRFGLNGSQVEALLHLVAERPVINARLSHGLYHLDGCPQAAQAEGESHLPQVSIVKTLVEALARHTTHFVVQIRPSLLLASAIEDESGDLGIEFHAEQNYMLADWSKAKRLAAVGWLCGAWRANLGRSLCRL
jgi:hypothetical protein